MFDKLKQLAQSHPLVAIVVVYATCRAGEKLLVKGGKLIGGQVSKFMKKEEVEETEEASVKSA